MNRQIRVRFAGILCGLLLPWVAAAHDAVYYLDVHRAEEPVPMARLTLVNSGEWCLHWNHSVAGFLVRDCFSVEAGQLLLQRSHQPDFAAGLDHVPERGELRSDGQGGYIIDNINEPVSDNRLRLRVGSERVSHRIVNGRQTFNLSHYVAGERIELRLVSRP